MFRKVIVDPTNGTEAVLEGDHEPLTVGQTIQCLVSCGGTDDTGEAAFVQGVGWDRLLQALRAPEGVQALAERLVFIIDMDCHPHCLAYRVGQRDPSWAWDLPSNGVHRRWTTVKEALSVPGLRSAQRLVVTMPREGFATCTITCGTPARLVGAIVDLVQLPDLPDGENRG